MKNEISLCMIVKNEEKSLPRCLNSIKDVVDEIIIVDTGSEDKTVEIAKSFGAKIYYFPWNDNFSEARNESLKYATKDWILILDADDELQNEDREVFKMLINGQLDESAVYFFQTFSYCGDSIDTSSITINLNPRLFNRNRGIHYEGAIHNQLIYSQKEYNIICNNIKIYHYGYLLNSINEKKKRERNISILNKQIKMDPNNKFAYFNLGNEYSALLDISKALECYYKAYEDFDPSTGYSFPLLIRIINANYNLGNFNKALEFIKIGIKFYPKSTDIYFLEALIYKATDRPTLQIKALEKCIEQGEQAFEYKFLYGTGSFRAYYELGNLYMNLKDYDTAYKYQIEALKSKKDFMYPLYSIIFILKEENLPVEEIKRIMESFFDDYPKAYLVIADLFYSIEEYKIVLEYVEKCEQAGIITEGLNMLKAKSLIRTGSYHEIIDMTSIDDKNPFYVHFSMYKVLSLMLCNKIEYSEALVNSFNNKVLTDFEKKIIRTYTQLIRLFKGNTADILSEEENPKDYYDVILEICEILLINEKLDEFDIAINLLNLINNKQALLCVGKLFYKYGYFDLAKSDILRSIKEFEVYDAEGLDMLRVLLNS